MRNRIKKVARLRDHPATPAGERKASFFATERLVKKLNFTRRSYERYFESKEG